MLSMKAREKKHLVYSFPSQLNESGGEQKKKRKNRRTELHSS